MSGPSERTPIPTRASRRRVFAFAEEVAKRVSLQPGGSLEPIVSRLGGRVSYGTPARTELRAPEAIVVRRMGDFTIHLPATTSAQRDRFTIAHELGHLFLHFPMVQKAHPGHTMVATRWVDMTDSDAQRAEWEANWFASAFLMPAERFRIEAERLATPALAALYGVSEQAVGIRRKTI